MSRVIFLGAPGADDVVEGAERVIVHRAVVHPDVIVVTTDGDVFVFEDRIAPRYYRDYEQAIGARTGLVTN